MKSNSSFLKNHLRIPLYIFTLAFFYSTAFADITFENISDNPDSGITYKRRLPANYKFVEQLQQETLMNPLTSSEMDEFLFNIGAPAIESSESKSRLTNRYGVALLDYDNDGDIDIYLPNALNEKNSLYSNQYVETGQLTFIDVAKSAGVSGTDLKSTGAAYADVNNDGHLDIFVYGLYEADNILYVNNGNVTFTEKRSSQTRIGIDEKWIASAAFGDVNGDGYVDLFLGISQLQEVPGEYSRNLLYLNKGDNTFLDVSDSSGIRELALRFAIPRSQFLRLPIGGVLSVEHWARLIYKSEDELLDQPSSMTWAAMMVDYDLDGDLDIVHTQVQSAVIPEFNGGQDVGYLRLLQNDGTGQFTDMTMALGLDRSGGAWMGITAADYNSDGQLDLFSTNFGSYFFNGRPTGPYSALNTRWFLSKPDGTFHDSGVEMTEATAFGWGTSSLDYDNDGDVDIAYVGSFYTRVSETILAPATLFENNGLGEFTPNFDAFDQTTHIRRVSSGLASGDLNNDGFEDVVSVSAWLIPDELEISLVPPNLPPTDPSFPGLFDEFAYVVSQYETLPGPSLFTPKFRWKGIMLQEGKVAVEINSANNDNNWLSVRTIGSFGLIPGGRVSRDGIGAVISFTPDKGSSVLRPVMGGSSMASQDALRANIGLGSQRKGILDILWPGGTRNRLYYRGRYGEHVVFPEIPVSYDDPKINEQDYRMVVEDSLDKLVEAGVIDDVDNSRFLRSAIRAFREHN